MSVRFIFNRAPYLHTELIRDPPMLLLDLLRWLFVRQHLFFVTLQLFYSVFHSLQCSARIGVWFEWAQEFLD
jgi:hypothetical protein